jgi:hypothetical protein
MSCEVERGRVGVDRRIGIAAAALGAAAVLMLVYFVNPAQTTLFPPCPFHMMTGLHCPGCGSLRAIHQLLNGNFVAAFKLNPLMVTAVPALAYLQLAQSLAASGKRRLPGGVMPSYAVWLVLGIIVAFWILRNIPIHPFTLLAP